MRFSRRRTCTGVLAVLLVIECAALRNPTTERPSALRAFADADSILAHGKYQEAIRAYSEFIGAYATSSFADDAYLRIAHIYLHYPDSARAWLGWPGADYAAARDTLRVLLVRYPQTNRRFEVENWIKLLDTAIRATGPREQPEDGLEALLSEQRASGASVTRLEADRARLRRSLRAAETERDSLRTLSRRLAEEKAALEAELEHVRAETERMKRMLIDLERRRRDGG